MIDLSSSKVILPLDKTQPLGNPPEYVQLEHTRIECQLLDTGMQLIRDELMLAFNDRGGDESQHSLQIGDLAECAADLKLPSVTIPRAAIGDDIRANLVMERGAGHVHMCLHSLWRQNLPVKRSEDL